MSIISVLNKYEVGAIETAKEVYVMPGGSAGTLELQIINPPDNDNVITINAWTEPITEAPPTFNPAGVIWQDYILLPGKAVVYDKFIMGTGERLCVSYSGTSGTTLIVQFKGFIEVNV